MVNLKAGYYKIADPQQLKKVIQAPQSLPTTTWQAISSQQPSFLICEITVNEQHYFSIIGQVVQNLNADISDSNPTIIKYHRDPIIEMIIDDWVGHFDPIYEIATAGINQRFWQLTETTAIESLTAALASIQPSQLLTKQTASEISYWIADSELPIKAVNFQLPVIQHLIIADHH